MADWYMSLAGAGAADGSSWADREAFSQAALQAAVDQLTAGDVLYLEDDTYTLSASVDVDTTSGANNNNIFIKGVNSSGVEDGSQATLDGNAAAASCLLFNGIFYYQVGNLNCINATAGGIAGVTVDAISCNFYNCNFDNNGTSGVADIAKEFDKAVFQNCQFNNNSTEGADSGGGCKYFYCLAIGNGAEGIKGADGVYSCITHDNTTDGINSGGAPVVNCISDGNGAHGINVTINPASIAGCRCTNNGGYGSYITALSGVSLNNAYYNNTTDDEFLFYDIRVVDKVTLTGDGYTDRASDDFTLATDGEGVGVEVLIGNEAASNSGFITSGVTPEYAAAAAGGRQTRFQIRGA